MIHLFTGNIDKLNSINMDRINNKHKYNRKRNVNKRIGEIIE